MESIRKSVMRVISVAGVLVLSLSGCSFERRNKPSEAPAVSAPSMPSGLGVVTAPPEVVSPQVPATLPAETKPAARPETVPAPATQPTTQPLAPAGPPTRPGTGETGY